MIDVYCLRRQNETVFSYRCTIKFFRAWHIEQIDIPEKETVIKCILFRDIIVHS